MVLPGELIVIPTKRKNNQVPAGAGRFATVQEREAAASQAALSALNNPIPLPREPQAAAQHNEEPLYDVVMRADGNDPALASDDEPINLPVNRNEYYRSRTYQEQKLLEEAQWRAIFPKLFIAFMPCRMKLSVELCDCTADVVRLIRLGYMGSSPTLPRTAFSYSSVRLASFTDTMDEYLDPRSPLFLVPGKYHTRDFCRCLSSAVDAYREMLRMEDEMASAALRLTPLEALATSCPSCFGPKVPGKRPNEPDHIICLDANFQQRRHLAASASWRGDTGVLPPVFLAPGEVLFWKTKMDSANQQKDVVVDPCSAQHTAADDVRGVQTWRGCDETGLMGMACRHDILLKFISIVQSGERGYYPLAMLDWILRTTTNDGEVRRFGILYDIGCSMEKGIIKRNLFSEERRTERLMFGTSVFHSYVHQWACQLKYNPRLNDDWGLSDGEGLERIWSSLASLVGALRYSTKAHRLCSLALRTRHTNKGKRKVSILTHVFNQLVKWLLMRLSSSQKVNHHSVQKLNALQHQNPMYTQEYLKAQWNRQRECQLRAMVVENSQVLNKMLNRLMELEEQHREAEEELKALKAKRRQLRTASEKRKITHLPQTILILDEQINELVQELGSDHYRDMPGASTPKGRLLIRIRVSKSKLYGAKVDVFKSQRKNDEREGTRMQQRSKKHLQDKQRALKDKYNVYLGNVDKFNTEYPSPQPIECPSLEEILRMSLADHFWDIGQLTHPEEAWAVDQDTRDGIQAYLDASHSHDEIRRVGRECRQAAKWALDRQEKLSAFSTSLELEG
ncbi:hypothetical protein DFH28DRAFT_1101289 [Melampsora americana]|nr:hypothetical protein DFH28DRAFT_1101289 [Melampsora americana]